MLPDSQVRWRAVDRDALAFRDWGGDTVVFNQETGSTHLLNELGAEVLRLLLATDRGTTVQALAAELADVSSCADDASWAGVIADLLSNFARLGLARPEKP